MTASALILGQFMFIICMYTRMTARPTKSKEDSLRFGRSTRKKQSLPCDDSDDVKMIKITSTDVDLEANEFSDGSSFADELVICDFLFCFVLFCFTLLGRGCLD